MSSKLSRALASHARETADVQDRSLTEQVEHWARIGQIVESTVLGTTIERLEALSHDKELPRRLAAADTIAGRRRAARLIQDRAPVRYGIDHDPSKIVKVASRRSRRKRPR